MDAIAGTSRRCDREPAPDERALLGPRLAGLRSRADPTSHYDCRVCGRYTQLFTWSELVRLMRLTSVPLEELGRRFNVAPSQAAPVVRQEGAARVGQMMRWGLVPSWAKDPSVGSRAINARAEGVGSRPTFRSAFKSRRCLVPVSGYYEWRPTGGRRKQPYWFGRADHATFAFAGLWESWGDKAAPLLTFTIITTAADRLTAPVHDRMPVILAPEQWDAWLAPSTQTGELEAMLRPHEHDGFTRHPVSTRVSNPGAEGEDLARPVEEEGESASLFG